MTDILSRYDSRLTRILEATSGSISFILILFPLVGGIFVPELAAYFIIAFDIYWLYKSITLALNGTRGYLAIRETSKIDWWAKAKETKGYDRLRQIIFIPNVNEPEELLRRTMNFLVSQEFDTKKISVVLATEAKVATQKPVADRLAKEFAGKFERIWVTEHVLSPGEVVGKSSNLAFAGRFVAKEITRLGWDKDFITVTSCDADMAFPAKYFAALAYKFLVNPDRYLRFWQGAILFYNNIWRVPMLVRVINTVYSVGQLADLVRPHWTYNYSSYSLSWYLLERSGFWDVDVIPEDWHLFFKTFFAHRGMVDVESIQLPIYGDAAEGTDTRNWWAWNMSSYRSNYTQVRRWAWGITDLSYALKMYLRHRSEVPFYRFGYRYLRAMEQHLLWPVNWFILTFGATIPTLVNPTFKQTTLGYSLPGIAGFILTLAAIGLVSIIILDILMRPPRPESFKKWHLPLLLVQYIFMPVTAFLFGALPGMDAHMRLILGKRLEYKVTEKRA